MKIQNKYTMEEKEKTIEEFKTSNLSMREFLRIKGIPSSTFRGWLDKENKIRFGEINIGNDDVRIPPPRATTVFLNDTIRIELKDGYDKQFLKSILEVITQNVN